MANIQEITRHRNIQLPLGRAIGDAQAPILRTRNPLRRKHGVQAVMGNGYIPQGRLLTCRVLRRSLAGFSLLRLLLAASCREGGSGSGPPAPSRAEAAFLDTLQARTFRFFWDQCEPGTGLAPDRYPTISFASAAATGFALTAYPIGAERGFVTRDQARQRVLRTLRFLWQAPQGAEPEGRAGYHGFFYHFLNPASGDRFENVELSTVDTALLIMGALFCQSYFSGEEATEEEIRALADSLYLRAEWDWASVRPPTIGHGWTPEEGYLPYDWRGYNEAMIVYLLALGSPTHPVAPEAWQAWLSGYRWGEFMGLQQIGFAPLFGHQFAAVWIDFRGIADAGLAARGIDYFENSRRATVSQYRYAQANPGLWRGYGPRLWGLTACDGPVNAEFEIAGRLRRFATYWARGASFTEVSDDGTICPAAAGGSIAFAPELALPALMAMREDYGDHLFGAYGFFDALNPTFQIDVPVQHGKVVPELGWFDTDYLGIDQGPMLAMVENFRSGMIWERMRGNAHLRRCLMSAGFSGGWLAAGAGEP
jgi:hypothetical protein